MYVFFLKKALFTMYFFLPAIVFHSFCLTVTHPHLSSYFVVERQDVVIVKGHFASHQRVQGHAQ